MVDRVEYAQGTTEVEWAAARYALAGRQWGQDRLRALVMLRGRG